MNLFLATLAPAVAMFLGVGFLVVFGWLARRRLWLGKRKSPFTGLFLRSPGHSLELQLDDARLDLMGFLMVGLFIPVLLFAMISSQAIFAGKEITTGSLVFYGVCLLIGFTWLGYKVYKSIGRLRQLRLGYEGEVGVGQELNQLMQHGFRVFHDFPADKFNIDHIVIGRTGVFAVETKARSKPDTGNGRQDARLEFDGQVLKFPQWVERAPLEQAARQAQWLSKWLSSAVGEVVPVVAAVAVPGWYVNQTKPSSLLVYSGKRPDTVFPKYAGKPLDAMLIQRVAHQVEAKCRDVAPRAYVER